MHDKGRQLVKMSANIHYILLLCVNVTFMTCLTEVKEVLMTSHDDYIAVLNGNDLMLRFH